MQIDGVSDLVLLASGGTSHVYRGRDVRHDRDVAVKIIQTRLDDAARARFRREVTVMGRLGTHPNIVTVLDSGFTDDGQPYLVTPFYADGTYADRLADGALPAEDVVSVGRNLAHALTVLHDHDVIHRDIKPDNVFVAPFATGAVLGDFGIATSADPNRTITRDPALSLAYAAPELLESGRASTATDIYALGATLWTLLEGNPPFTGEAPSAVMRQITQATTAPPLTAQVPTLLADLIATMMSPHPDERPGAGAVLAALTDLSRGTATSLAYSTGNVQPAGRPAKRRNSRWRSARGLVTLAALLALVAATGFALASSRQGHSLAIYDDALVNGFAQHRWIKDVKETNLAATTPVQSGVHSISITQAQGWGGLALTVPDGLKVNDFRSLTVWVWSPTSLSPTDFYAGLHDQNGQFPDTGVEPVRNTTAIPARTWQQLTFPMTSLTGSPVAARAYDTATQRTLWLGRVTPGELVVDEIRLQP